MAIRSIFWIGALLVAAPVGAQSAANARAAGGVDSIFIRAIRTDEPGCAVGVRHQGRIVLERGYGLASLEHGIRVRPTTRFDAASVSKSITALTVALLAQEGRLSLEDDIRRHLRDFPSYGHPVTLRQLLQHTSGVRDFGDLFATAGWREEDHVTEADVLRAIYRQRELNFVPGTHYLYTNAEYVLLARVVRQVAGRDLREVAAERVFRPLGMTRSAFNDDYAAVIAGRAWAYERSARGRWRVSLPANDTYGPSNLVTTVGDLLRWLGNFETAQVGGRALLEEMQRPGKLADGRVTAYGLGLDLAIGGSTRSVGHTGANAGYRSTIVWFPDHRLGVAVLCNRGDVDAATLARATAALYAPATRGELVVAPIEGSAVDVPADSLRRFVGVYRNPLTDEVRRIVWRDGRLVYARGAGSELVPLSLTRFRFLRAQVEVEFRPASDTRPGEMRVAPAGQPSVLYELSPSFAPSPTDLQAYEGEYYSNEADATYLVTAADSVLMLRVSKIEPFPVRPAFPDAFNDADFVVRFTRNDQGQIDGFRLNNGRVLHLRFVRRR